MIFTLSKRSADLWSVCAFALHSAPMLVNILKKGEKATTRILRNTTKQVKIDTQMHTEIHRDQPFTSQIHSTI